MSNQQAGTLQPPHSPEPHPQARPQAQGRAQQHMQPQAQPQAHVQPQAQPQAHVQPQAQPQAHVRPQAQPQAHVQPHPQNQPQRQQVAAPPLQPQVQNPPPPDFSAPDQPGQPGQFDQPDQASQPRMDGALSGSEQVEKSRWHEQVPTGNSEVATKGMFFVFGFLVLFLLWAFLFPISSAVVSTGKIVSAGANKLIQHPSGGVVKQILVEDGERVKKNQVLIVLNPATSQAELGRLTARRRLLQGQLARLQSERGENGFDRLTTISGLELRGTHSNKGPEIANNSQSGSEHHEMKKIVQEQRRQFEASRRRLSAQIDAATSQMEALKDQRSGFQARMAGEEKQLEFTEMELKKVRPLANQGYLPKNRLWELERRRLEQVTAIGNLDAEIASTTQRISEVTANIALLEQTDQEERSQELSRVNGELSEIRDQIKAAQTDVTLTELRSPVDGVVTGLTANTNGGVITGGATIAEIVPDNSGLITEFRVAPQSVKSINVGQKARITVTAFNQRTYLPIDGEVTYVSADSQFDEQTGEIYFLARAKLTGNPEKNDGVKEVKPGMQTQVFALAEPRVFMDYLTQPIRDSFDRAFRETN